MALFNLRLPHDLQHRLEAEAARKGVSRSDIARDALLAYLASQTPAQTDSVDDDWSDLGSQMVAVQHTILKTLIAKIGDAEWREIVEPIYALFRAKTIAKSRAYHNPMIFTRKTEAPFEPIVIAAIGFASDDIHEIKVSLEQLLFEYCWSAGDDALDEVHEIVRRAAARAQAGEAEPSTSAMIAARNQNTAP